MQKQERFTCSGLCMPVSNTHVVSIGIINFFYIVGSERRGDIEYYLFSFNHIVNPLPVVPGLVGEEVTVQHLIVDVPVLHQSLHSSNTFIYKKCPCSISLLMFQYSTSPYTVAIHLYIRSARAASHC